MIDAVKKAGYAAIGLAMMTGERVEEMARKVAEDAKMSESEGRKFIDEMLKKSEESKDAMEKLISERVEATLNKMNICSKNELDKLEMRVRALETELAEREKK
ncbi:hypothetical protein CHISP_1451 [Chitinispirillum alkaliphilum]|nr:hypothetical protein CHISP_1451 [Chitinispirillum alkaliphilum]